MSFICEFEMRVKGKELDAKTMLMSMSCIVMHCYESLKVNDEIMIFVSGRCFNSINETFIETPGKKRSLAEWSKEFGLEIEIAGMVPSDRELIEHYHYKDGELLYSLNLPHYISLRSVQEGVKIQLEKYIFHDKKKGYYTLKPEYTEEMAWSKKRNKLLVNMRMDKEYQGCSDEERRMVLGLLYDHKENLKLTSVQLLEINKNQELLYDLADMIAKYDVDEKSGLRQRKEGERLLDKIKRLLNKYGYFQN